MSVTGHWIQFPEFKIHHTLLDFIHLTERHSGDYLGKLLFDSLKDLGLLTKVSDSA